MRLNPTSVSLIAAWAEAGGRLSEIAAAYGVDPRTVRRWQRGSDFSGNARAILPGIPYRSAEPSL